MHFRPQKMQITDNFEVILSNATFLQIFNQKLFFMKLRKFGTFKRNQAHLFVSVIFPYLEV